VSDRGHAAVEFGLAVGLLLLPVALAVLSFGPWSERRVLVEAAAAEAARAAVISLDLDDGGQVVSAIARDQGIDPDQVRLGWCGATPAPVQPGLSGCVLARGAQVEATVQFWAPLVSTPWGSVAGLWVTGSHAEPIDLYRSLG